MIEYNAYIEVDAPEGADVATARTVDETFEGIAGIEGPAAGIDTRANTISVRYNIMAGGPDEAIETGLARLSDVLGYRLTDGRKKLVAVEAKPWVDPAEGDYVTQAEIARRLRLSTTRIGQLVETDGFPPGTKDVDSRRRLYRWGDVVTFRAARAATARPGRPRRKIAR